MNRRELSKFYATKIKAIFYDKNQKIRLTKNI